MANRSIQFLKSQDIRANRNESLNILKNYENNPSLTMKDGEPVIERYWAYFDYDSTSKKFVEVYPSNTNNYVFIENLPSVFVSGEQYFAHTITYIDNGSGPLFYECVTSGIETSSTPGANWTIKTIAGYTKLKTVRSLLGIISKVSYNDGVTTSIRNLMTVFDNDDTINNINNLLETAVQNVTGETAITGGNGNYVSVTTTRNGNDVSLSSLLKMVNIANAFILDTITTLSIGHYIISNGRWVEITAQNINTQEVQNATASYSVDKGVAESSDVRVYVDNAIITQIANLDYIDSPVTNKVVTTVSETDGLISVTRAELKPGNGININQNYSSGSLIGNEDINISVNVKSGDAVLSTSVNGLESTITLHKLTQQEINNLTNPSNIKYAYQLLGINDQVIGDTIRIDKNDALTKIYLGNTDDSVSQMYKWSSQGNLSIYTKGSTDPQVGDETYLILNNDYVVNTGHTVTSHVTSGNDNYITINGDADNYDFVGYGELPFINITTTGSEALCFVYQRADGSFDLVAVDVESFLTENEFKDGLKVTNHEVQVNTGDGIELGRESQDTSLDNKRVRIRVGDGIEFGNPFIQDASTTITIGHYVVDDGVYILLTNDNIANYSSYTGNTYSYQIIEHGSSVRIKIDSEGNGNLTVGPNGLKLIGGDEISKVTAGNGISITNDVINVTINTVGTTHGSDWFNEVTQVTGTSNQQVYKITTIGHYENQYYEWNGTEYINTSRAQKVDVSLATYAVLDGTTTPSVGVENILNFDSNGDLTVSDTWDCGDYVVS